MGHFSDYFERRYTEHLGSMPAANPDAAPVQPGAGAPKPMWAAGPTKATPHSLAMELGVPVAKVIQTLTAMGVKSRKGSIDPASSMPPQIADKVRTQLDQRRVKPGQVGPGGPNWIG